MLIAVILAGDIGGTKTLLGLFEGAGERPRPVLVREFITLAYEGLGHLVDEFVASLETTTALEVACFGVAGPVIEQTARLVNVPWGVDALELAEDFGIPGVELVNDLAAMAYAVPVLEPDELAMLQEGLTVPSGNAALIAAGTGLGEAMLHNIDGRFWPAPSEGGHADFAARTGREIELLQELTRVYGRVDVERVVSGPGIANLFHFTHPDGICPLIDAEAVDPIVLPALVSTNALTGRCERCREALDLFVAAFGAEAGNLALRSVATAGVYIGGGIAPKILPALETGAFLAAFRAKDPLTDLLASMPVAVILNPTAGLLGAAVRATQVLTEP